VAVSAEISGKVSNLPHKPGVYLMKDRFGTVIYVGKARDLRRRVSQYFQPSRRLGWDPKFRALVEAIRDLEVHMVRSEPEAILLEGKLIKELRPRYNISFRDDKRFLLLKINLNDPIPRFTLTRLRTEDGARYFGPFANSGALRRTLNLVRHKFNLRGCRPFTPGEPDYKHCLYAHLKVCTAPCIGNVTREQYLMQVHAACDFLDGQCAEMKAQLDAQMRKAATQLDFEKAAELRDLIVDIESTTRKVNPFARIPYSLPVAVDPDKDLAELARTLNLPTPPIRIEGFDISNISGTFAVASMVTFCHGRPDRAGYRKFKIRTVIGQDDFACMAETVRRRYTRLMSDLRTQPAAADRPPPTSAVPGEKASLPDLILIDGGKGQLNAACAELAKLGLDHIPVIGLAKEFEEIHQPGRKEPLRLSHDSGALKLLQRVRDESHRLANTYNAQLRLKRISESLLDEFPGIGEQRKAALLKRFGSVRRLQLASVEEIASVAGFGGKAAAELKAFLEARREAPTGQRVKAAGPAGPEESTGDAPPDS
jgi:excinuclease ABC subunit C